MRRTPLYWSRYSIGSRTPARDCTRSRGKYRLFPRSPPTSLMSQRSTRRITGADTCASRCVYPEYSGGASARRPRFLEMGPDAQLVACGQREYRDNAYWIASARRNKEASDVLNQALLQLYAAGVALPWADLLAGDGQRIAAPCYPFDTERYWKERVSRPASLPTQRCLPGWRWRVAPRQRSISLAWKRLNSAPRDCTPSTSINWYNAVPAMPLRTAWTP